MEHLRRCILQGEGGLPDEQLVTLGSTNRREDGRDTPAEVRGQAEAKCSQLPASQPRLPAETPGARVVVESRGEMASQLGPLREERLEERLGGCEGRARDPL